MRTLLLTTAAVLIGTGAMAQDVTRLAVNTHESFAAPGDWLRNLRTLHNAAEGEIRIADSESEYDPRRDGRLAAAQIQAENRHSNA